MSFKELIEKYAYLCKLDPVLVEAIIFTESANNPYAVRYEPKWRYSFKVAENAKNNRITYDTELTLQKCSWGLGQVMGTVARELGYTGPLPQLCDPELGIKYCVLKLHQIKEKYDERPIDWWISAYNMGMPVISNDRFMNNQYVDKVLTKMEELNKYGKLS